MTMTILIPGVLQRSWIILYTHAFTTDTEHVRLRKQMHTVKQKFMLLHFIFPGLDAEINYSRVNFSI